MQITLIFITFNAACRFTQGLHYFQGCVIVEKLLYLYRVMPVKRSYNDINLDTTNMSNVSNVSGATYTSLLQAVLFKTG